LVRHLYSGILPVAELRPIAGATPSHRRFSLSSRRRKGGRAAGDAHEGSPQRAAALNARARNELECAPWEPPIACASVSSATSTVRSDRTGPPRWLFFTPRLASS